VTEIVIGGDMADIPEGTYPATLTAISTRTSAKFEGEFRVWTFTLDSGSVVDGNSSMSTNSKSKGGRWLAALLGRVPAKGETVNPIGRPCLVHVAENGSGWPSVDAVLPPMAPNTHGFKEPIQMHEGMGDDDPRNVTLTELP
jgi:hypothetical protein